MCNKNSLSGVVQKSAGLFNIAPSVQMAMVVSLAGMTILLGNMATSLIEKGNSLRFQLNAPSMNMNFEGQPGPLRLDEASSCSPDACLEQEIDVSEIDALE